MQEQATHVSTDRIPLGRVESSQIARIGYDADSKTLAIQFKSRGGDGSIYHYGGVSQDLHDRFVKAPSIGTFFGQNIKNNPSIPYVKMPTMGENMTPSKTADES